VSRPVQPLPPDPVAAELVTPDAIILAHPLRRWLWARAVKPLLDLLRIGASPRKLAWSLAAGAVIGINPIVGTTTAACFAAALLFRLNVVAIQLANYLVFPAQLAMIVVFVALGGRLFRMPHAETGHDALTAAIRAHDWRTAQLIWTWEWHALVAWAIAAALLTPLLAAALTPLLERLLRGLQDEPIVEK
jgi:uncharacterized protein (DUF2062 family)